MPLNDLSSIEQQNVAAKDRFLACFDELTRTETMLGLYNGSVFLSNSHDLPETREALDGLITVAFHLERGGIEMRFRPITAFEVRSECVEVRFQLHILMLKDRGQSPSLPDWLNEVVGFLQSIPALPPDDHARLTAVAARSGSGNKTVH